MSDNYGVCFYFVHVVSSNDVVTLNIRSSLNVTRCPKVRHHLLFMNVNVIGKHSWKLCYFLSSFNTGSLLKYTVAVVKCSKFKKLSNTVVLLFSLRCFFQRCFDFQILTMYRFSMDLWLLNCASYSLTHCLELYPCYCSFTSAFLYLIQYRSNTPEYICTSTIYMYTILEHFKLISTTFNHRLVLQYIPSVFKILYRWQ